MVRRRILASVLFGAAAVACLLPRAFVAPGVGALKQQQRASGGAAVAVHGEAPDAHGAGPFGAAALAGLGMVAVASMAARSSRRGSRRAPQAGRVVMQAAAAPADGWKPRFSSWKDEELAAKRQEVESMADPGADYAGPHYKGPESVNDQFVTDLLALQKKDGRFPSKYAYRLVLDVIDILGKEPTLRKMSVSDGTLTMVGDIHGQFYDLFTILENTGRPSKTNQLLFNGDYVDRGSWSIEVVLVIFALKAQCPEFVGMNRGNHEMLEANIIYGFLGEVAMKYDVGLFDLFSEAFRRLPLAHLIDDKIFVVHGGLPGPNPRIWMPGQTHDPTDAIPVRVTPPTLEEIAAVDRNFEIGPEAYAASIGPKTNNRDILDERITIDLLWSDPRGGEGYGPSYRKSRGVYMFGTDVTESFVKANNLQCVLRSHEVKNGGYSWDHKELCTVFSAPNYLDTGNNRGAVLRLSREGAASEIKIEPITFTAVAHPDLTPMHWQSHVTETYPYLLRKMRKKVSALNFDEFGDSDFEGLMNFDEWEPDEADHFQEAFRVDEYGRPLEEFAENFEEFEEPA